jgi:hypothetical protein
LSKKGAQNCGLTTAEKMRRDALRRYIVFRIKAVEFLDIGVLWQGLKRSEFLPYTPVNRTVHDFAWSIRTVILSWFALFIDKNGMDVIPLWKELFPKHASEIEKVWSEIKPFWGIVRAFRDRAGFHADKPHLFFAARGDVIAQIDDVVTAIYRFEQLFRTLLKAEASELPELGSVVDEFLDELDSAGIRYEHPREQFKTHYMFLP